MKNNSMDIIKIYAIQTQTPMKLHEKQLISRQYF